ncbi:P2X purinoceptor 7 [Ixodes scapularis]|uniref:P2X purinoceptor 7 n=1 Tax=Ixodes scapularis TaxID=6945 RepID=UPI0011619EC0|nr:P2X purinoceptor 7 [Ixodes scapularis]
MNLPGLSELEVRILHRSAELGVVPYEDTPRKRLKRAGEASRPQLDEVPGVLPTAPLPEPPPPRRVGSTDWCDCGRCTAMPTARECFCCRELAPAVRKQPTRCITLDGDFSKLCLDVAVLAVAYCEVRESGRELQHQLHEKYRFVAYRQFTRWMWGRLGAGNRRVLPACAVHKIRKTFPSQRYTGFRYPSLDSAPVDS